MKRAALLVLALTAALVVIPGTAAFACSCAAPPMTELVARAALVVKGTPGRPQGDGQVVTYRVEVAEAYKGTAGRSVTVGSARDGASCGLEVEPGREYVLFAAARGDGLEASLCGGTAPATTALVDDVEAVTGPGRPPTTAPEPSTVTTTPAAPHTVAAAPRAAESDPESWSARVLPTVLVALVLAGAGVVVLRRRRT